MNHLFQKHLVEDYTIINWDQRGELEVCY